MRAPSFWWRDAEYAAALLAPLGWAYGAIAARRMALAGARAGVPVLCIGNPTVGGAGKTPTVRALAAMLAAQGQRPVVLMRGYGGRLPGPVRADPARHDAADIGDEALLLARAVPTIVARDRVAGARAAVEEGATVIVMDDGFQNPSLHKDLAILVVDAARGIGNARTLPAGPLRLPLAPQLARAQALLVIGEEARAEGVVARAAQEGLRVFRAQLRPDADVVAELSAQPVLAFAGIGDPDKFFRTLARCGVAAPVRRAFPDHHRYTESDAARLLDEAARQGLALLTTEKDAARLDAHGRVGELGRRARVLPVTLEIADAEAFLAFVSEKLPPLQGTIHPD